MMMRAALLFCTLIFHTATTAGSPAIHLHLTGIGGKLPPDYLMERGLMMAGVAAQIIIDDWTGEQRGLAALVNQQRHASEARRVAGRIVELRRANPTARITVSGHSGGAGIAAWALAQLPEDVTIDDLILVAPAVSPQFDLSPALARVKGRCFAFNSLGDVAVLGAGTRTMGTIDRIKIDAAGRVGFFMPALPRDASQYAKLRQVFYQAEFLKLANNGEHMGAMMTPFAARVLAAVVSSGELPEWVEFLDGAKPADLAPTASSAAASGGAPTSRPTAAP
jgi:pimeloyl-ACP methyl ester carboxylesterase